jgi:hypothetical protein
MKLSQNMEMIDELEMTTELKGRVGTVRLEIEFERETIVELQRVLVEGEPNAPIADQLHRIARAVASGDLQGVSLSAL